MFSNVTRGEKTGVDFIELPAADFGLCRICTIFLDRWENRFTQHVVGHLGAVMGYRFSCGNAIFEEGKRKLSGARAPRKATLDCQELW